MSFLEEKATQIAVGSKDDNMVEVAIDPITIMAIIGLIIEVVQMFRNCQKTPEDARVVMSSPNWLQLWKLRGMVRQELKKHGSNANPNEVLKSILDQGKHLSVRDVATLYSEAAAHLAVSK